MVAMIARTAVRYAPADRALLYYKFHYTDADGAVREPLPARPPHAAAPAGAPAPPAAVDALVCAELEHCARLMGPVVAELDRFLAARQLATAEKSTRVFALGGWGEKVE
jgi:hypothetical protein